ncbi:MAG: nucleotide exchange factor GrpE [Oligoflexia bacterium]|nr:nucleotide exchange factor GrpE [Oligoflexia bacterium]
MYNDIKDNAECSNDCDSASKNVEIETKIKNDAKIEEKENNIESTGKTEETGTKEEAQEKSEEKIEEKADEKIENIANKAKERESEDFKNKYYYLAAEMDNLHKRFQREKESIIKFSNERMLLDLIDVMDNFERTLQTINKDNDEKVKNITTGITMITNQFATILNKYGLSPIKSLGETFDPNFHEAVAERETENNKEQEILEEYQKGYILNGRVIRAAKVVVSKT